MKLTRRSDYAVRVLMYLGLNADRRCTVPEIAAAYGISERHLVQVVRRLGRCGFVETAQGRNGGLRLALPPDEIGLGAVVRAAEPDFRLAECFARDGADACAISGACALTGVLETALEAFMGVLDRHTLADLLAPSDALRRALAAFDRGR